jgi:hypothetical protein
LSNRQKICQKICQKFIKKNCQKNFIKKIRQKLRKKLSIPYTKNNSDSKELRCGEKKQKKQKNGSNLGS